MRPEPEAVPPDPGGLLHGHAPQAAERKAAIDALLAECIDWLRKRCTVPALAYGVDAGDIFQATIERLLKSSTSADLSHRGLRTWLGKAVDWAALDLLEKREREGGVRLGVETFAAVLELSPELLDEGPAASDTVVDPTFLARLGLNPYQVQVVLNECAGPDLSLKEFARLTCRSYVAVRKDKQRALDQIESWMGLSPEETRVFIAFRTAGSVERAAARVGMSTSKFRGLLDSAHKKVDLAFSERRVDLDVP